MRHGLACARGGTPKSGTLLAPVRVASVPAGHPYVLRVTEAEGVEVLPDPVPAGAQPGQWWPPVMIDPDWIRNHADAADLLHIHFGTESFAPDHLARTLDAAHTAGWPVVVTAHDLQHPQIVNQAPYIAQLKTLMGGADAVVTLTQGAADEIHARWSRKALVLAHPRLLDDEVTPDVRPAAELLVGLHLKDLRPNVDAVGATRALLGAVEALACAGMAIRAEVRTHRQVRNTAEREAVRALCGGSATVEFIEHDRLDDHALARSLARLDACVLPYAHGTHSGWLELCWDLGVPVVAPAVGYYREQHADGSVATTAPFCTDPTGASLAAALRTLVTPGTAARPGSRARAVLRHDRRARRRVDDRVVSAAHADLYRHLVAERPR